MLLAGRGRGEGDELEGHLGVILLWLHAWGCIGEFYDGAGVTWKVILVSSRILQDFWFVNIHNNVFLYVKNVGVHGELLVG